MKSLRRPSQPMEAIAMDLMQFNTSNSGNCYLLNIMCLHSRFARCIPIKDKRACTILKAFFDSWVNVFGKPSHVTSDNGKEFTDKNTQNWAKENNINWIFTSPYTPRSDAVERLNRTIKRYLRVMVPASKQADWDDYVSSAQMSYNSALHRALQHSPFAMVYLRQVNYPWIFYKKEDLDLQDLPWEERAAKFRDIIYEDAAKADQRTKDYNKMSWDKKKGTKPTFGRFKRNDKIWYLNPLPGTGKFAKPYLEATFQEYLGSHTAEISIKNGATVRATLDRLKPRSSDEDLLPLWDLVDRSKPGEISRTDQSEIQKTPTINMERFNYKDAKKMVTRKRQAQENSEEDQEEDLPPLTKQQRLEDDLVNLEDLVEASNSRNEGLILAHHPTDEFHQEEFPSIKAPPDLTQSRDQSQSRDQRKRPAWDQDEVDFPSMKIPRNEGQRKRQASDNLKEDFPRLKLSRNEGQRKRLANDEIQSGIPIKMERLFPVMLIFASSSSQTCWQLAHLEQLANTFLNFKEKFCSPPAH